MEFKHHLVSWDVVCSPVKDGGMGVRNLVVLNKALLGKWLWRFGLEEHRLWRCVLVAKYGLCTEGWCTDPIPGPHGCGLWKSMMGVWNQFIQHVGVRVGVGSCTCLWHDCRCGESPLKEIFPALFECAVDREASVALVLSQQNGGVEWNVTFIQNFNDWEMDEVTAVDLHFPLKNPIYSQPRMLDPSFYSRLP